jgi:nickel transport protein
VLTRRDRKEEGMKIDKVKHHRRTDAWGGFGGILMLVCLLVPTTAMAHKVTVFAWVEGNTVHTESKFSGGRVAKDSRIEVYDTEGQKLLEGRTDDQGRFTFQAPRQEALRIVLIAGTGHRNEWRVAAEEFTDAPSAPPASVTTGAMPQPASTGQAESGTLTVSPVELQALIEQALDRKLAPIMHRLVALDKGPSLSDIIGGIGYIIGLVGLGAYIHSRRKSG